MNSRFAALICVLAVVVLPTSAGAVLIYSEGFETDGQGSRYTASSPFSADPNAHWNRTDGSNISNVSAFTNTYTGQEGTFFWAAEDVDDPAGNGAAEQSLDITGINVSSYENLQLSVDVAADGRDFAVDSGVILVDRGDDSGNVACGIISALSATSLAVDFGGTSITVGPSFFRSR